MGVIYDYECLSCGLVFEVRKPMSDDSPVTCECGGSTRKLISSATSILDWKDSDSVHASTRFRAPVRNVRVRRGGI